MHNILNTNMNDNLIESDKIVCALDIGTSKVAALVGKRNQYGKIEILGIGICPSFGVQRGVVVSITKTVESIRKAVKKAEEQSGITFTKVHVGIAGQHIKSIQNRSQINRTNIDSWITHEDVRKLKNESYKIALPPGDKILHVLQQEFIIDNETGIQDPVGMMGVKMEGNFHIITGADSRIKDIERSVTAAGLEVASIELEPLASADAVLSKQELEAGVCLVDIGGGTTDIAIFENFIIRHTAVIPLGGNIITEDLKDLRILREHAEELKIRFGSAIPTEDLKLHQIDVPGVQPGQKKSLNLMSVAKVISARMIEILANVEHQIKVSGYSRKLIGGIVLTGGGSQLKHLVQLTELETGQSARVGLPHQHLASTKNHSLENPIYATGIGLLIRAFKMYDEEGLIEAERIEKSNNSKISTQINVHSTHEVQDIENEIIEDLSEENLHTTLPVDEQAKETKKPSIISSWKQRISNFMKDGNDFTDI